MCCHLHLCSSGCGQPDILIMVDTIGCKYSHVSKVNLDSTEVVHCQHSAVLVLVTKETVALGLPCLLVLNQVDVHYLTISVF